MASTPSNLRTLPGRLLRGIRDRIPQGYILGRVDKGEGPVQLISISDIVTARGILTVETFIALTDTPANYTSAGSKVVQVNSGATALEFVTAIYDIGFYANKGGAAYANTESVLIFDVVRAFTLPEDLTGSEFNLTVNPTGTTVFTIHQDGTQRGSLSFNTSSVVTVTFGADITFAAGEQLIVKGPASADATASGLSGTFKGTR